MITPKLICLILALMMFALSFFQVTARVTWRDGGYFFALLYLAI